MKLFILSSLIVFSGCISCKTGALYTTESQGYTKKSNQLKILHLNDHHDRLSSGNREFSLAGLTVKAETGGFPALVSLFRQLQGSSANVLKLHAGDALMSHGQEVGWFLSKGFADAELMNQICFTALTLGNHEFDNNEKGLNDFIQKLHSDPACQTPVVSANIQSTTTNFKIHPYIVHNEQGNKVAIIGLTTSDVPKTDTRVNPTTVFAEEIKVVQALIKEIVQNEKTQRIILLTHIGYEQDLALASQLTDVDVIVGGHSHTLLGNQLRPYGFSPQGEYPTLTKNAQGDVVCVVQASAYGKIVGELDVLFDDNDRVLSCQGTPHVVLTGKFKKKNPDGSWHDLSESEKQNIFSEISQSHGVLHWVEEDQNTRQILDKYQKEFELHKTTLIGKASQSLCLERFPKQGISELAGCKELTQHHGSDITQWVTRSFLHSFPDADIALINAGDVRSDLSAGEIKLIQAYNILPYTNHLVNVSIRGSALLTLLEDAIAYSKTLARAYPYASGLRWKADLRKPKGSMLNYIEMNSQLNTRWQAIQADKIYHLVTTDYLISGQKGYFSLTLLPIEKSNISATQAFIDYVLWQTKLGKSLDRLPVDEYSTQEFLR